MEKHVDIIIVGSGAAGMMAALTAGKYGKKCLMLEKGKHIAVSNGSRAGGPALANTVLQKRENELVTEQKLFSHMYQFSRGTVNAGLLRNAIANGATVEKWFTECGITMELLPDTYGVGFRARQMFQVNGKKRWQPLADLFQELGGEIRFGQEGYSLIVENGKVSGVCARDPEDPETINRYYADAVILATGGYLGNEEMIREHFGDIHVLPLGSRLSDGAGIRMALEAGGREDRNWGICGNEFSGANSKHSSGANQFSSETRYAVCGGLLVNQEGRRFMNEQHLSDQPLSIGAEEALRAGRFYAVLDAEMYEQLGEKTVYEFYGSPEGWETGRKNPDPLRKRKEGGFEKAVQEGWAYTGTLAEISEKAKLPELEKTVGEYNQLCETGEDVMFGKASYLLKPITKEPYYIFEYEPSAWCTFGGVKTDEYCRLLDKNGKVIQGIYVAGVDNGSCYTMPYFDNEGAALGLALTTGIVAGKHAAESIKMY